MEKVFSGYIRVNGIQMRGCIAVSSQKKVSEITGLTLSHIRTYWCLTRNKNELDAATSKPGTLFVAPSNGAEEKYFPIDTFQ